MRRFGIALAFATSVLASGPNAHADTPFDILGTEKSVNDLSRRAQETGDHIAQAFAEQALRAIAEWKKANGDLINTAFEKLDAQSKAMFREINDTASRIERGEAVTFLDLQRTMVTTSSALRQIPGSPKDPQVTFSYPSVVTPTGEPNVTVHVIGSFIGKADAKASLDGKNVPVHVISDNEITLDIDRSVLGKKENERLTNYVSVTYVARFWLAPNEQRKRDIPLEMLPEIPGSVKIVPRIRVDDFEKRVIGPVTVGGKGQDSTYETGYALTPLEIEQGWVVDKEAQQSGRFDDGGGGDGGSSCSGFNPHKFSDRFVAFNLQLGHNTSTFHKSDAHQNCRIWVYEQRPRRSETDDTGVAAKILHWQSDTDVDLPKNTISTKMTISLFTGRVYTIANDQQVPYDLFEITRGDNSIKFRPRPLRDF